MSGTLSMEPGFGHQLKIILIFSAISCIGSAISASASTWVLIDISSQKAYIYKNGEIEVSSPISSGRRGRSTRPGTWRIYQKSKWHKSYYGTYVSRKTGEVVVDDVDSRKRNYRPSGTYFRPDPMTYFLRFNGPIGFHAGECPGYPSSHGCIRLPIEKAAVFYDYCRVGTKVVIQQ